MPVKFKPGERTYTNNSQAVWQVLNTVWKQIKFEFPKTTKIETWVFLDDTMCSLVQDKTMWCQIPEDGSQYESRSH
jgi:hypothetical protein